VAWGPLYPFGSKPLTGAVSDTGAGPIRGTARFAGLPGPPLSPGPAGVDGGQSRAQRGAGGGDLLLYGFIAQPVSQGVAIIDGGGEGSGGVGEWPFDKLPFGRHRARGGWGELAAAGGLDGVHQFAGGGGVLVGFGPALEFLGQGVFAGDAEVEVGGAVLGVLAVAGAASVEAVIVELGLVAGKFYLPGPEQGYGGVHSLDQIGVAGMVGVFQQQAGGGGVNGGGLPFGRLRARGEFGGLPFGRLPFGRLRVRGRGGGVDMQGEGDGGLPFGRLPFDRLRVRGGELFFYPGGDLGGGAVFSDGLAVDFYDEVCLAGDVAAEGDGSDGLGGLDRLKMEEGDAVCGVGFQVLAVSADPAEGLELAVGFIDGGKVAGFEVGGQPAGGGGLVDLGADLC